MKKLLLVLALIITGCTGSQYEVPAPIKATPNTIPPKAEKAKTEADNIIAVAGTIEDKEPTLKPEVAEIKESAEVIKTTQDDISKESEIHEQEKNKLISQLEEVTNIVKNLKEEVDEIKQKEARNIKIVVIGLFALSAIGFIAFGNYIPGTGFTVAGGIMAGITVCTAITWNYLEQHPLAVTAGTCAMGIGAVSMWLMKKENEKNKNDSLGFG